MCTEVLRKHAIQGTIGHEEGRDHFYLGFRGKWQRRGSFYWILKNILLEFTSMRAEGHLGKSKHYESRQESMKKCGAPRISLCFLWNSRKRSSLSSEIWEMTGMKADYAILKKAWTLCWKWWGNLGGFAWKGHSEMGFLERLLWILCGRFIGRGRNWNKENSWEDIAIMVD